MSLETLRTPNLDSSGFAVFSHGDAGRAHVMAHRRLDGGDHELGHRWLGHWLATHDGGGSDWTHLQWHMGVFELELGLWDAALERFVNHILPMAAATEDALTDAPAMLWRLQLTAARPVALPWEPIRRTATRAIAATPDPYVALHCVLALAGAGDVQTLDRWIETGPHGSSREDEQLLARMASGLRAFAVEDYRSAAEDLALWAPSVAQLGGSRAQNELFQMIADQSVQLSNEALHRAA